MEAMDDQKQEEKNARRKKKTPSQVEMLEKVFAEDKFPSESVRAELSLHLGLSDRQLQMWFCNRRLKDRKSEENQDTPKKLKKDKAMVAKQSPLCAATSEMSDSAFMSGVENYCGDHRTPLGNVVSETERPSRKRESRDSNGIRKKKGQQTAFKFLDARRVAEMRAIASVEAELGEPLREDGPILAVEFDPLPPAAFDTPTATLSRLKLPAAQEAQQFESKSIERRDTMAHKNIVQDYPQLHTRVGRQKATVSSASNVATHPGSRALHEYQFIPEQPSARTDDGRAVERCNQSKFYMGLEHPLQTVSSSSSFLLGRGSSANVFGFNGRLPNIGESVLAQSADLQRSNLFSESGINLDGFCRDSLPGFSYDNQFGVNQKSSQTLLAEASKMVSGKLILSDGQEQARMERKRKSEEARIAKEIEAHEKRIKREFERQEIARKKREEQMQKELEKQHRERLREAERALREKQREEDRIQRELKRELERREREQQKEAKKMERQLQKEEIRRQKEAAKMKSAFERATLRRLARESIELIDDERLELLEAAATSQSLPSIYLLDGETLQGLDKYRGFLKNFPPPSVKMKIPIAAHPWIDSDQNIGSLFMVWRFLTTFADILGLWPFTVDELAQSLHDYDPRLLGEIHIALLRTLVKDIEDVAQASTNGMVVNQYTVSFTGGGHPQLVEAAFAWGFNIRDWCLFLDPLTWPEVLRQFALAAGYGPKWKKRKAESDNFHDDAEGNEVEDAVKTLRSGVAAANAVALMRGKGGVHARRSQHRLTPGTVKYAAFNVLSLEGEKGLTVLEVVDRIQKFRLRDLSSSKTPEASIAAAFSRDTKLFERVAPSTYCVRKAYRKDPRDSEAILEAAREQIRLFRNGLSGAEDAEKETEDVDVAEREEEYEEDIDDILGDDMDGALNEGKLTFCLNEGKVVEACEKEKMQQLQEGNVEISIFENHNSMHCNKAAVATDVSDVLKSSCCKREGSLDLEDCLKEATVSEENEIDESYVGEPWVQGLMEGDYCGLSVEERLDALVALVEMVNEGNTIRVALEERLEAANVLKRQMWVEAQLDRRRIKEEQLLKSQPHLSEGTKLGGPIPIAEEGQEAESIAEKTEEKLEWVTEQGTGIALGNSPSALERSSNMHLASNHDNVQASQAEFGTDKSRAQLKADIVVRAEELYVYRLQPLGFDRRHNRYWQFVTCNSGQDPGCGRIYFESSEDGHWEVLDTEEALDALMASLDMRGVREAHLHASLLRCENHLRLGMRKFNNTFNDHSKSRVECCTGEENEQIPFYYNGSTSEDETDGGGVVVPGHGMCRQVGAISIEVGHSHIERQLALERYGDLEKWLWSSKWSSSLNALKVGKKRIDLIVICEGCHDLYWPRERHCSRCHVTFETSEKLEEEFAQHQLLCEERQEGRSTDMNFKSTSKFLPSRMQLLKAKILAVETALPVEAMKSTWTETRRKRWVSILRSVASAGELLQLVTELEGAIHRDWLSLSYETTEELLRVASSDVNSFVGIPQFGGAAMLPWVPHTTAAVAFFLMIFDAALSYSSEQKQRRSHYIGDTWSTRSVVFRDGVPGAGNVLEEMEDCPPFVEDEVNNGCSDGHHSVRGRGIGRRSRGRGRGRGRGWGGSVKRDTITDCIPKVFKRKLQFSQEVPVDNQQAEKNGSDLSHSFHNYGGTIIKGRRWGSRSARRRQSYFQKSENTTEHQVGKLTFEQFTDDGEARSDEDVSQTLQDWEAGEYDEVANGEQYDNDEEEDIAVSTEELDEPDQEQIVEDGFEQVEAQYGGAYEKEHAAEGSEDEYHLSPPLSMLSSSPSSSLEGIVRESDEDDVSVSQSSEESD